MGHSARPQSLRSTTSGPLSLPAKPLRRVQLADFRPPDPALRPSVHRASVCLRQRPRCHQQDGSEGVRNGGKTVQDFGKSIRENGNA